MSILIRLHFTALPLSHHRSKRLTSEGITFSANEVGLHEGNEALGSARACHQVQNGAFTPKLLHAMVRGMAMIVFAPASILHPPLQIFLLHAL